MEAAKLFKQILAHSTLDHDIYVLVMSSFCNLLIYEYLLTRNEEAINEAMEIAEKLLKIAEKQESHRLLVIAHIINAKIMRVLKDYENAKHILNNAREIAKEHNLIFLLKTIEKEEISTIKQLENKEEDHLLQLPRKDVVFVPNWANMSELANIGEEVACPLKLIAYKWDEL